MSDKTLEMTMLFDFFGDLLTEKQRDYFNLYYNEDLSLSEIADNVGITRQGVHDIIARAENTLMDTEKRTGIIKRFEEMRDKIDEAAGYAADIISKTDDEEIRKSAEKLAFVLQELKG